MEQFFTIENVKTLGVPVFYSIVLLGFVLRTGSTLTSAMDKKLSSIEALLKQLVRPFLTSDQALNVFVYLNNLFIYQIVEMLALTLSHNNLKLRRDDIQRNIKVEFYRKLNELYRELDDFETRIGGLSQVIKDNVDFESFFEDLFAILFSEASDSVKLVDLRKYMEGYLNRFVVSLTEKLRLRRCGDV